MNFEFAEFLPPFDYSRVEMKRAKLLASLSFFLSLDSTSFREKVTVVDYEAVALWIYLSNGSTLTINKRERRAAYHRIRDAAYK